MKTIIISVVSIFGIIIATIIPLNFFQNSAQGINGTWPNVDSFVSGATKQGQYIDREGSILWEKVAPNQTTGKLDHICGSTFILMATQANWDGSSAQQGSQMTVVDNSSVDSDSRCGYFKINRANSGQAQEFLYRIWEIQAPNGYSGLNIVNSYAYNTQPQAGIIRSDNLIYYPNSSWQSGQEINGWNFGQIMNYSIPVKASWEKVDENNNHIGGASFDLYNSNPINSNSPIFIRDIQDCVAGNDNQCQGEDKDSRAGYFRNESIDASGFGNWNLVEREAPAGYDKWTSFKQVYIDQWNTNVNFGTITNYPSTPPPPRPSITFSKVDSITNSLLPGSKWSIISSSHTQNTITDCAGTNSLECPSDPYKDSSLDNGKFKIFIDDFATITNKLAVLNEISPPAGYTITGLKAVTSSLMFTSCSSSLVWRFNNNSIMTIAPDSKCGYDLGNIENEQTHPFFKFFKVDSSSSMPVTNTTWSLTITRSGTGNVETQTLKDNTGSTGYYCKNSASSTNNNWCDIDEDAGSFYLSTLNPLNMGDIITLRELTTNSDYQLNSTTYTITCNTLDSACEFNDTSIQDFKVPNTKKPPVNPIVHFEKWSDDVPSVLLGGSKWSLTCSTVGKVFTIEDNDGSPSYTGIDKNPAAGIFDVEVVTGTYKLQELSAPDGYKIADSSNFRSYNANTLSASTTNQLRIANAQTGTFYNTCLEGTQGCYDGSTTLTPVIQDEAISPQIGWAKVDTSGSKLWGSEWTLCATADVVGGNCTGVSHLIRDCNNNRCATISNGDQDPQEGEFAYIPIGANSLTQTYYTLIETKAPPGYTSNTRLDFEIRKGDVKYVGTATNDKLPEFTFTKVSSAPLNDIPIGKSTFHLIDTLTSATLTIEDCVASTSSQCYTGTNFIGKDKDERLGYFDIVVPNASSYELVEETAPVGFDKSNSIISSTISLNDKINLGKIYNTPIPPMIYWTKRGYTGTTFSLLGGVTFSVKGPNPVDNIVNDNIGTPSTICDPSSTDLCDADPAPGKFLLTGRNLANPGTYTISETAAPENWFLDGSNKIVSLNLGQTIDAGFFRNDRFGSIAWTNCDKDVSSCPVPTTATTVTNGLLKNSVWTLEYTSTPTNSTIVTDCVGIKLDGTCTTNKGVPALKDEDPNEGRFLVYYKSRSGTASLILTQDAAQYSYIFPTTSKNAAQQNFGNIKYDLGRIDNWKMTGNLVWEKIDDTTGSHLSLSKWVVRDPSFGTDIKYNVLDNIGQSPYTCQKPNAQRGGDICDSDPRKGYFDVKNIPIFEEFNEDATDSSSGWVTLTESKAPSGYDKISGTYTTVPLSFTSTFEDFGQITNSKTVTSNPPKPPIGNDCPKGKKKQNGKCVPTTSGGGDGGGDIYISNGDENKQMNTGINFNLLLMSVFLLMLTRLYINKTSSQKRRANEKLG